MLRAYVRLLAGLIAATTLAACQTTERPPPLVAPSAGGSSRLAAPPLPAAPGRRVAERKGWVVEAVPASITETAHCRVSRPTDIGATLSFQAAPGAFSMLIGTPRHLLAPGAAYELTLAFEGAASESLEAMAVDSGTLAVRIYSLDYEDITDPFARSKRLVVSSPGLGTVAEFALAGSSWAINALDECRRLHTQG